MHKVLVPYIKTASKLTISRVNRKDAKEIWETDAPLFWVCDSPDSGFIVDLKLMQNLARTFDAIIKEEMNHK